MSPEKTGTVTDSPREDGGSGIKKAQVPSTSRRRTKISEKKIADDEFMAAAIGDVEWLKQSIKDKKNGLGCDKNGLTPLHLAAIHGRLDCLKLLIEKHKIDVNLASSTGWRPIHLVISNQTGNRALQCLSYLLEKGADPSVMNEDGITPCHQAASEGHVECLKLLMEVGSKIDGKDHRGHTPLDLAKLWGRRKCARFLSAEVWHQEKHHVAKEMTQLKRLKQQQLLQECEEQEQVKAEQEFYGDIAFNDWLDSHKLQRKPTGPSMLSKKPSDLERDSKNLQTKESLQKANSVVAKRPQKPTGRAADNAKAEGFDRKQCTTQNRDNIHVESGVESIAGYGADQMDNKNLEHRPSRSQAYINPSEWVKSTKVAQSEYTMNLSDDYPRDAYTMMPKTEDAPKFYDGSFWRKIETPERQANKLRKKKLRQPDLPNETVQRVLSRDHTRQQRPFIFRPVHIYDVNIKKKYPLEKQPRSEASLHMCNDVSSYLFQKSLQKQNLVSLSRGSSSSQSSQSSQTPKSGQRLRVANTFTSLSEPKRFPRISGEEYELHLVK